MRGSTDPLRVNPPKPATLYDPLTVVALISGSLNVITEADDARWSSTLSAKVEEQLSRTTVTNWFRIKFLTWIMLFVSVIAPLLLVVAESTTNSNRGIDHMLSSSDINELYSKLALATNTNSKNEWMFTFCRKIVENAHSNKHSELGNKIYQFVTGVGAKGIFLCVPVLIIIAALVYLWMYCYPHAVFNWGDYGEHYANIVSRRKFIWTVIVVSLAIGIIGNLFVFGLSGFVHI